MKKLQIPASPNIGRSSVNPVPKQLLKRYVNEKIPPPEQKEKLQNTCIVLCKRENKRWETT
jgi:hypothetical protein